MCLLAEEVAAHELDGRRIAAAVLAHVEDDRVAVGYERHGRRYGVARHLGWRETAHVHVADVALQVLDAREAEVLGTHPFHPGSTSGGGVFTLHLGTFRRQSSHAHVLVAADLLENSRQRVGESARIVQVVEGAGLQLGREACFALLGNVREDVAFDEQLANALDRGSTLLRAEGVRVGRLLARERSADQGAQAG